MFIVSIVIICVSVGCMAEVIHYSKKIKKDYELKLSEKDESITKTIIALDQAREETRVTRTTLEGEIRNLQIEYKNLQRLRECHVVHTTIPTITLASTFRDTNAGWQREAGLCFTADEIKEKLVMSMIPELVKCLEISETRDFCTNEFVTLGTLRVAKKNEEGKYVTN